MAFTATIFGLAACHHAAPSGQVLAVVGDQDITVQDVRAEGRADGVPETAGPDADKMLLARVVDRTLLAQSANRQRLDQTPESPSDLTRIEQVWRADKAVRKLMTGVPAPTDAQASNFIAAHPYAFAKRERVNAHTITIAGSPTLYRQLRTYPDFETAARFLKGLGVPMSEGDGQVDTARLSPDVAAELAAVPIGGLLIMRPFGHIQVAKVMSHTPVVTTPEEQMKAAKLALANEAASQRVGAELLGSRPPRRRDINGITARR